MCGIEIVLYPQSILRQKCIDVVDINDEKVQNVILHLLNVMDSFEHCVGLAANQIGFDLNIFVADASKNLKCESKHGRIVVANPILQLGGEKEKLREGCMSVPDFTGDVVRSKSLILSGIDETGDQISLEASGFEARVFQHEVDHLSGKVFLDRVQSSREVHARRTYRN
jgi:peptide deformylase